MKSLLKKALPSHHSHHDLSHQPLGTSSSQGELQQQLQQKDTPSTINSPTSTEILRYRQFHGVNLGSIFVLEQWLYPGMFDASATGGSELDAVTASIAVNGVAATCQKWQTHWATALSDADITYLAQTLHCTTIRLPIGYFTLGSAYTAGTPFLGPISQVYTQAWPAVIALCTRLQAAGIAILLDLHALPGGANPDAHSGTSSGVAALWSSPSNLSLAQSSLLFLTSEVASNKVPGCAGIQLCNEAIANAPGMYTFYANVLAAISAVDATITLYISDAWDLPTALAWCSVQNTVTNSTCPIIVDTHRYYCFAAADKAQSPQQIINSIPSELFEVPPVSGNVTDKGAAQCVVGEYSCVLDSQSWAQSNPAHHTSLATQFGQAQTAQWRARSAGSFFWTAKMDWMPGGEWGLWAMAAQNAITAPANLGLPFSQVATLLTAANAQKAALKALAVAAHQAYWDQTSPGQTFEHWRFGAGWDVGFEDAVAFFGARAGGLVLGAVAGGDRIGGLEVWVRKRIRESGSQGAFVWEWEQGFRQGVSAAEGVLLV